MLAAGMLREAAALTTQITGEIIRSDKPGCLAMAVREPAGVVLSVAALVEFLEARLARYKIPKLVTLMEGLPRNGAGKLVKAELRR